MQPIDINNKAINSCASGDCCSTPSSIIQPLGLDNYVPDDAPCCGAPTGPPSSPFERPGYTLCSFVDSFVQTVVGPVPRVRAGLLAPDYLGTMRARAGIARDRYLVAPGLYAVGSPGQNDCVLVSANYKLSFDALRHELDGVDAWILVLDTRGVNVWCAAGKKTFSTAELVRMVKLTELQKVVAHRELIVPQLGAPGVAGHLVKKGCGFKVYWGPVRAADLKQFLKNGKKATAEMRQVRFSLRDRMVLVPVELSLVMKPSLFILLLMYILAGVSPQIFTFSAAWQRGGHLALAYAAGILAGAIVVPALLPWIPFLSFYLKGLVSGTIVGGAVVLGLLPALVIYTDGVAMLLVTLAVSSYAAMNFTGTSAYTSPSGVEKEMRRGIPLQVLMLIGAAAVLLWGGFNN